MVTDVSTMTTTKGPTTKPAVEIFIIMGVGMPLKQSIIYLFKIVLDLKADFRLKWTGSRILQRFLYIQFSPMIVLNFGLVLNFSHRIDSILRNLDKTPKVRTNPKKKKIVEYLLTRRK